MLLAEKLQILIEKRSHPSPEDFVKLFINDDKTFIAQEDTNWDFKDRWPFSYSDDYFLGIARLMLAFANTGGGYIIFGVHDTKRLGGHNKVTVNLDKLRQSVAGWAGRCPGTEVAHFGDEGGDGVDCLLVLPRPVGEPPYRFIKANKYGTGIFVRDGHSVRKAEPKDFRLLYCRNNDLISGDADFSVPGSMPAHSRTMDRFIGRMTTVDYLFDWFFNSDEPLTYIYGRGGSGKTTVAHEFAKLIKDFGANLKTYGGHNVDIVLFLSAKEKSFVTADNSYTDDHAADFSDEVSLYRRILTYSGLYDEASLDGDQLPEIRAKIVELFDTFSMLIVLDDIDTLTTKRVEVGTSYLNRILGRSKQGSKILCTQRDPPAHAIGNSLEVPGLAPDGEYQQFVAECAAQYEVKPPDAAEIDQLGVVSGRRPLVVEYIIVLTRTCANYEAAFRLYGGDTGNDIRDYVFQREWVSLAYGQDARLMLAALALMNQPASASDLAVILQFSEARLRDSIASARAMFLQVNSTASEAAYSLDEITRMFVLKEAENLDYINTIKARIKIFKKDYFPDVPQITRISMRASEYVRKFRRQNQVSALDDAWRMVSDQKLPVALAEHPQLKSVFGFVASEMQPPRLNEARAAFKVAMSGKYEPPVEHLRSWFEAERQSGIGFLKCVEICDYVLKGRGYSESEQLNFLLLKASTVFHGGRDKCFDNPIEAAKLMAESLQLHTRAYKMLISRNDYRLENSERMTRNTAIVLFDHATRSMHLDQSLAYVQSILQTHDGVLDPVEQGMTKAFGNIYLKGYEVGVLHRTKKELAKVLQIELRESSWLDRRCWENVKDNFSGLDKRVSETLRERSATKR